MEKKAELERVKFLRDEAWEIATTSRFSRELRVQAMSTFAELQRLSMDMQKSN